MSGYTDDIILRHRIAEEAYNFLPKPFTARQLLEKVNLLSGGFQVRQRVRKGLVCPTDEAIEPLCRHRLFQSGNPCLSRSFPHLVSSIPSKSFADPADTFRAFWFGVVNDDSAL